jgi:hypothetical protein
MITEDTILFTAQEARELANEAIEFINCNELDPGVEQIEYFNGPSNKPGIGSFLSAVWGIKKRYLALLWGEFMNQDEANYNDGWYYDMLHEITQLIMGPYHKLFEPEKIFTVGAYQINCLMKAHNNQL